MAKKTAAELLKELNQSSDYQKIKNEKNTHLEKLEIIFKEDEKELLKELSVLDIEINSVWDFVNRGNDYSKAIPTLIKHLETSHHPRIMSGIVRSLAIKDLNDDNKLWEVLVNLYDNTSPDLSISKPEERGLQESIALALETLATSERISDINELLSKNPNGDAVEWLQNTIDRLSN